MADQGERSGGESGVQAADLMETPRTERMHRMIGRLLQVFPEESIEAHTETVERTIDAIEPQNVVANFPGRTLLGLSNTMIHPDGERPMVVVEDHHTGRQTVFYRSNSHATWRAMLAWAHDGYIAKGMFGVENSADAPIPLQKALSKTAEDDGPIEIDDAYRKLIFALTNNSQHLGGGYGIADKAAEGKMLGAWMDTEPRYSAEDIASGDPRHPFREGKEPILDELIDAWTINNHPFYGVVTYRVFPSADGIINYMINSSSYNDGERNQHWMGAAEVTGKPVTSLGLTRTFVEIPRHFLSPPIDYKTPNSDEYGERRWRMTDLEDMMLVAGMKTDL